MIAPGEAIPSVLLWREPSTDPIPLGSLVERPLLLLFYLYDWSTT